MVNSAVIARNEMTKQSHITNHYSLITDFAGVCGGGSYRRQNQELRNKNIEFVVANLFTRLFVVAGFPCVFYFL
ncbi:MAG: hypothetical protein AB1349_07115 [Elusimicrobiota bacterium]